MAEETHNWYWWISVVTRIDTPNKVSGRVDVNQCVFRSHICHTMVFDPRVLSFPLCWSIHFSHDIGVMMWQLSRSCSVTSKLYSVQPQAYHACSAPQATPSNECWEQLASAATHSFASEHHGPWRALWVITRSDQGPGTATGRSSSQYVAFYVKPVWTYWKITINNKNQARLYCFDKSKRNANLMNSV